MADNRGLITYVDSSRATWQDFRPGSRRKVLGARSYMRTPQQVS